MLEDYFEQDDGNLDMCKAEQKFKAKENKAKGNQEKKNVML